MRVHVRFWLPTLAWATLILIGTSISLQNGPDSWPVPSFDKLIHAGIYGVLALLLFEAFQKEGTGGALKSCLLALFLASAYGGLDELHQYYIPTRQMDVWDWLSDICGATIVLAARLSVYRGSSVPAAS